MDLRPGPAGQLFELLHLHLALLVHEAGLCRRRADPQVINFKKAQKQAQKKAKETGGYLHKCAVCGLTDEDDPNMEFRYCSKCNGYYCYCANHINNHTHVQ